MTPIVNYEQNNIELPPNKVSHNFWCEVFGCKFGDIEVYKDEIHYCECKRCGNRDYFYTFELGHFNITKNN